MTRKPWYTVLRFGYWKSFIKGWLQYKVAVGANRLGVVTPIGKASFVLTKKNGEVIDLGVRSYRVVTDAFCALLVDACDTGATPALDNFNYMGFGSNATAEAASDTALNTEFTTEYATDNTRPTGTVTQPAANQYKIVATFSPDATCTVEEAGVFTTDARGSGTLMDRFLTDTVDMSSGDSLEGTYTLTFTSGG